MARDQLTIHKASLHFCSECNNLLYPKADPQRQLLTYACRICPHEEIVENKCVYKNDLLTVTKEQVGVTHDLGADPTLAHSNIQCPKCGHDDAVFYQDQSKRKETRMILFYVCVKCNHTFMDENLPEESKLNL
ncbi:DNA-directed RNA polymerase II [Coprinopsis sp. MPI-PUGE-AT-0042]|nr:DNA-directed RNA polymerase II [Coprinopsis sp. MPI-PUGE-AT-0042]